MTTLDARIDEVEQARRHLITDLAAITDADATWRPDAAAWSIAEIVEHLVLAEHSGVFRMWQAAAALRSGERGWSGEITHRGRTIEEIIAVTWREREDAPANCVPQANGPLTYWLACLASRQTTLVALGDMLRDLELTAVIAPHYLSGPLDADQRLQFLRWHIVHHQAQIAAVRAAAASRLVVA